MIAHVVTVLVFVSHVTYLMVIDCTSPKIGDVNYSFWLLLFIGYSLLNLMVCSITVIPLEWVDILYFLIAGLDLQKIPSKMPHLCSL